MTEFKIINKYINRVKTDSSVVLGIGDDAAVINVPEDHQIVQTMDTMVLDVHFDAAFSADALAHKLLHVNLSDIAAMGAVPKWATIALTMPEQNERWLDDFAAGLQSRCALLGVNLVGGDTTSGPLTVSMNLTGIVKKGEFLTRSGAKLGDDIYVSGYLGDAALALTEEGMHQAELANRLRYPEARYLLGEQLYPLASACLDISDGLLADLGHICEKSHVRASIEVESLPFSRAYRAFFDKQQCQLNPDYGLNGGDDYELCFTADPSKRKDIDFLTMSLNYPVTRVGTILSAEPKNVNADNPLVICVLKGSHYECQQSGWQHFAEKCVLEEKKSDKIN